MAKTVSTKTVDPQVKCKVLKDFEDYKKGDVVEFPERKVKDSSRILKRGYIKPIK